MVSAGEIVLATEIGSTIVMGTMYDSTGGTISTAEAVEATVTLTVPANWATYDLSCLASFRIVMSGTLTATRTITQQLRKTNLAGTSGGVMATLQGTTSPTNHHNVAMGGRWPGETTTGSVSVVLTMITSGDNAQSSWDDIFMQLTAIRLT